MNFDSSCAARACVFNRARTGLDRQCKMMFKELIPTEPCLYTDLNPGWDFTHTLDSVHIGLTTCCQLLTEPT